MALPRQARRRSAPRRLGLAVAVIAVLVVAAAGWYAVTVQLPRSPATGTMPVAGAVTATGTWSVPQEVQTTSLVAVLPDLDADGFARRQRAGQTVAVTLLARLPELITGFHYRAALVEEATAVETDLGALQPTAPLRYQLDFTGELPSALPGRIVVRVHAPAGATTTPYVVLEGEFAQP